MNADLSSLEDKTKQNCIIDLDPDYVATLNVKGYDAHLNLGLIAGFFTDEEVDFFKWYKKLDKDKGELESLPGIEKFESYKDFTPKQAHDLNEKLAVKRQGSKTANYSCLPLDTQVFTNITTTKLEDMTTDHTVFAKGGHTRVDNIVPFYTDKVYWVEAEDHHIGIETTLNHRWLLESGEYKELKDLVKGDRINIGNFMSEMTEESNPDEIVTFKGYTYSRETEVTCLTTGTGNFYVRNDRGHYILTGNCTYGVGAPKLAASADIPLKEARKLINSYWDLNWSVKEFAESLPVKEVRGQKFIWSPFSRLWLVLRADHMKFSIINQNFGATVADVWVYFMEEQGYRGRLFMHDEQSWYVKDTPEEKEKARQAVQIAIEKTNEVFNLPVKFGADAEFAYSYGDVH